MRPARLLRPTPQFVGTWRCVEGTEVVFRADGTASVTLLDGQERDYDSGWRVSGPATWTLPAAQPAGWNERRGLELYFYGDPGARSPYVLERDP
ncbi:MULTISPECIES: hypothetical protein [unclassified Streptomyces]|uniref:hypothetical protein n=1 Tax=unclassified Streptomyces TaxID=2593676 RepID=UPI000DC7BCA6|nr:MULTISPECIES: hypothetical protein [unclassified Streptomyces]AWZ04869.1 hypothetical protein DRB89_09655 [Streptomyces sp. ICC4]AWZ12020.1 hypothetical protein DRB96_06480 [Streptomyces sp. ICC1]